MARLPKFTLEYDDDRHDWALEQDRSGKIVRRFENKGDATRGGVLQRVLGPEGGSVKIQKRDGDYQEERTYPRSKDPRRSPG